MAGVLSWQGAELLAPGARRRALTAPFMCAVLSLLSLRWHAAQTSSTACPRVPRVLPACPAGTACLCPPPSTPPGLAWCSRAPACRSRSCSCSARRRAPPSSGGCLRWVAVGLCGVVGRVWVGAAPPPCRLTGWLPPMSACFTQYRCSLCAAPWLSTCLPACPARSFNDIVKRLAAQEPTEPTFVSKRADAVERFVVAHGQIILNQFQNYPGGCCACPAAAGLTGQQLVGWLADDKQQLPATARALTPSPRPCLPPLPRPALPAVKEVRSSAFASTLRERMAQLRHSKLYKTAKKEALRVRAVNRNPMKVSGCCTADCTAIGTALILGLHPGCGPATAQPPRPRPDPLLSRRLPCPAPPAEPAARRGPLQAHDRHRHHHGQVHLAGVLPPRQGRGRGGRGRQGAWVWGRQEQQRGCRLRAGQMTAAALATGRPCC